ncbi:MAG: hypothetical protein QME58_13195, partial [Bacteroidota bacterium]|nr:hypothetical protein [Bacteroidota bacterium]
MNTKIKIKIILLLLLIVSLHALFNNSIYAFPSQIDDGFNTNTVMYRSVYFGIDSLTSLSKLKEQISSENSSTIIRNELSNLNPIRKTFNDVTSNHTFGLRTRESLFSKKNNRGIIPLKIEKSIDNFLEKMSDIPTPLAITYKAPDSVTIKASASEGGKIDPSDLVRVEVGSNQKFTIAPDEGYYIGAVYIDDIYVDSTTSYTFVNVIEDHTIHAAFAINQYTITSSAGANGTISPLGVVNVNYGANQQFTIIPNTGYHVDSVIVNGVKVDSTTSYTFNNVTSNHTIRAVFAINQFTITSSSGANGTIFPLGVVNVNYGANQQFTIIPNTGYHVDSVLVNGVKVDSTTSYTFNNVTSNHTIRAVFAINQFTITSSSGANGTITPLGPIPVSFGD